MRRGFMSLLLLLAFVAALVPLARFHSESDEAVSNALLKATELEKDYYLRASLRHAMEESLASGGIEELSRFADYASRHYATEGITVEFWCAQSPEAGLGEARKWHLDEKAIGYCVHPLYPERQRADIVSACSLMLAVDEMNRTVSIVRANGYALKENGELCFYPQLASEKPSVIGATISYPDGNASMVVLPEGVVIPREGAGIT